MIISNYVEASGTLQAPLQLLVIEDSRDDFDLAVRALENAQLHVNAVKVASRESFTSLVATHTYDVILADYRLPGWTGIEALEFLKAQGNDTPLILVTGALGEEKAIECIKRGVADLILKNRLSALPAAVCRAISERTMRVVKKKAETSLRESEARFRTLADSIASAVLIYQGTECQYTNRTAQRLTGYSEKELLDLTSWDLVHPASRSLVVDRGLSGVRDIQGSTRYETKILTKQGEVRVWDVTLGKIEIEGEAAGLVTALDITESKAAEALREHGGYRDPLTGLLSSAQAQQIFFGETKRSQRTSRSVALVLLKLDNLKQINEESGLSEGRRVLCKLANIVGDVCRHVDSASRYADDEFVLILPETAASGARHVVRRIAERLKDDIPPRGLAMSAGVAAYPQDGSTIEHSLRAAKRDLKKIDTLPAKELARSA
ncbi:MAG TPA: diguanylate cyclase [Candidatus Dormibacteraeota bacterium]|nr:diguanylate cyclase [Candidatus Dormibacteraeota bacterium]